MTECSIHNCIPVKLNLDIDPPEVLWMKMENYRFTEPMFDDSVKKSGTLSEQPIKTTITKLIELDRPGIKNIPKGFIFHVGRCGSTMLSNALQQLENALVISEPSTINTTLEYQILDRNIYHDKDVSTFEILHALISRYANTENQNCFIKLTPFSVVPCVNFSVASVVSANVFTNASPYRLMLLFRNQ